MTLLGPDAAIGVLGAGAMGSGIAQVAAAAGHQVLVTDASAEALEQARARLTKVLAREVEKGRLDGAAARALEDRITWAPGTAGEYAIFRHCTLVIEAILEDLAVKRDAFQQLEAVVADDCVLATNTSSLSVTAIAGACRRPARVLGLHFFNPAPVLPLVELIPGLTTDSAIAGAARRLVEGWGKTVVQASDTPGFIVNRIARPYYAETLALLQERAAEPAVLDACLRGAGFRMGPCELMDLIGHDTNFSVTESVYQANFYD
jgi:3-hydroxybutyryl-CoA dehydrogenase